MRGTGLWSWRIQRVFDSLTGKWVTDSWNETQTHWIRHELIHVQHTCATSKSQTHWICHELICNTLALRLMRGRCNWMSHKCIEYVTNLFMCITLAPHLKKKMSHGLIAWATNALNTSRTYSCATHLRYILYPTKVCWNWMSSWRIQWVCDSFLCDHRAKASHLNDSIRNHGLSSDVAQGCCVSSVRDAFNALIDSVNESQFISSWRI